MLRWLWVAAWLAGTTASPLPHEVDSEQTRKLVGSSVVTSVSVVMDHGNGTRTYLSDNHERTPQQETRQQVVGTPGTLLAPDRYEFYSFGEEGELVKKLMTLDQIQSLIAGGDELEPLPVYYPQPLVDSSSHTEGVHKVLESVQNVLKGELQNQANLQQKLPLPMPHESWSILLPGLLNSEIDPTIPLKGDVKPLPSNDILPTKPPIFGQKKPTSTTTKYTTQQRPSSQATISTTRKPMTTPGTKPSFNNRPENFLSTPSPFTKSTQAPTKPATRPPPTTQKRPYVSTKKPYVSDSVYANIPLINAASPSPFATKPTTKRPVVVEERNPSTKQPEIKKPVAENIKQKPSGIPTITHYLPISSSSSSPSNVSVTMPSQQPSTAAPTTTTKQKTPSTTKDATRPTTTKKPNTKPAQSTRVPVKTQGKPTNNKGSGQKNSTSTKGTHKPVKPTSTPLLVTKSQTKAPTTSTKGRPSSSATPRPSSASTASSHVASSSTTKQTSSPNSQKLVTKKPEGVKPSSNLIGQSSNVVNTKVKTSPPPTTTTQTPSSPTSPVYMTTTQVTSTTTPLSERITTFSYSSKLTANGEIVTSTVPSLMSQQKSTTSAPSTVQRNNVTHQTEKPMKEVTLQQSTSSSEAMKPQFSSSSFNNPTTFHPQHSFGSTLTPTSYNTPSLITKSTLAQLQRLSSTPAATTEYSGTVPTTKYTYTTDAMTTTKPNDRMTTTDGTTMAMTTLGVTSDTTNKISTEDMPLQEIPLKLYQSLKEDVAGAQDIMTTIMAENMPTTTNKFENTFSTMKGDETTLGSTMTTAEKLTTLMASLVSSSTAAPTTTIMSTTNDATMQEDMLKAQGTEQKSNVIDKNSPSINSLAEQHQNSSESNKAENMSTTSLPGKETTESTTDISNTISDSTTNMDSTTMYKDQIIQDGISAVTSILLDEAQRQEALKEAVMASVLKEKEAEKIRATTETNQISTMNQEETMTLKQEELKSEVRVNDDDDLLEKNNSTNNKDTTTKDTPTSTVQPPSTTPESGNKSEDKKAEVKPQPVLPNKESKLTDTDQVDDDMEKVSLLKAGSTPEPSLKSRTTSAPEMAQEKIKIVDFEKSAPKPTPLPKKPNPAFQPLESLQPPAAIELHPAPYESMGLEASIAFLGEDVRRFADLCNELAFKIWTSLTGKGQISSRSLVMSPFAVTSLLAMVFLGARGPTSGQMNEVLRLDDMVTFNPHQVFQNVTESVINSKNYGVATAAFVRELYSDKSKGKILDFYKERVQQYYQGHVEEISFSTIGDIIRRRTNLLVKRQTLGKVPEYLRGSSLNMRPPLAAFSANIFQTDCEAGSTEGRDGEMYFVVRPSTRQRRLVPVPAVVWRSGFLAGYEPSLDATSVCLGADSIVSTILILPGQQGQVAPGDGLARLEQRLIETSYRRGGWSRLLRSLMPRPGLELQIPRFSHRSVLNVTSSLQRMGLRDLFNDKADLRGLNGLSNDLHLSDMLQVNTFSTCGEETIGARHHVETYPASPQRMGREDDPEPAGSEPVVRVRARRRQARLPDNPRLRFDRPFLYMVRHNPSGMILHIGRFNPRLLP